MLIVERIINDIVILENDNLSQVKESISKFNFDVNIGDVVFLKDSIYMLDVENTNIRKEKIAEISRKIFNK